MNDLQIDYFMAVATNLSFTKTAEELYVSQPAISRQISLLEKELGARLFVRSNQKTELTDVGRLYFDLFARYKADLMTTRLQAAQIMGQSRGEIRVGFLEGWDLFNFIPPMIERFKAEYPESDAVIECCGVKEITKSLMTDSMDIAVTMKNSVEKHMGFDIRDAAQIGKLLLFSSGHPLAGKEDLSPADFRNDTFFAPWQIADKLIIEAINSYTRPYGFVPELRFVKNHESMVTCVRNNMGVAIIDEWVWARNADDLCTVPLSSSDTISIVRLKEKKQAQVLRMEEILADIIGS